MYGFFNFLNISFLILLEYVYNHWFCCELHTQSCCLLRSRLNKIFFPHIFLNHDFNTKCHFYKKYVYRQLGRQLGILYI